MLLIKQHSRVLAIGAHPDDIEIGAGGFICRLVKEFDAAVTFFRILELAHGRDPSAAVCRLAPERVRTPRLTETWFC